MLGGKGRGAAGACPSASGRQQVKAAWQRLGGSRGLSTCVRQAPSIISMIGMIGMIAMIG